MELRVQPRPEISITGQVSKPIELPSIGGFDTVSLDTAGSESAYKSKREEEWKANPTEIPWPAMSVRLGIVTPAGIPALKGGKDGADLGTPGAGKAYLYDFNGQTLSGYGDGEYDVFNLSAIPISGNTPVLMLLFGDIYFAVPVGVSLVHAVVTQAIQPCNGTVPGTGKIQFYTMQNGSMQPSGQPVDCENWFNVTADVGKHCAVTAIDGGVGLEVLDC